MLPSLLVGPGYADFIRNTPDLYGYWRLGDQSGTRCLDETGRNHGTYVGTPTLNTPGAFPTANGNAAVTFSGSAQYVTLPVAVPTGDIFSIAAWVKPVTSPGTSMIFNSSVPSSGTELYLTNIRGIVVGRAGVGNSYSSTLAIAANVWTFVAITKSGAAFALYTNGKAAAFSGAGGTHANGAGVGSIGAEGSSFPFNGAIDEVAVWTGRVLPAGDFAHMYNLGMGR